jgi:hypothetical protein
LEDLSPIRRLRVLGENFKFEMKHDIRIHLPVEMSRPVAVAENDPQPGWDASESKIEGVFLSPDWKPQAARLKWSDDDLQFHKDFFLRENKDL